MTTISYCSNHFLAADFVLHSFTYSSEKTIATIGGRAGTPAMTLFGHVTIDQRTLRPLDTHFYVRNIVGLVADRTIYRFSAVIYCTSPVPLMQILHQRLNYDSTKQSAMSSPSTTHAYAVSISASVVQEGAVTSTKPKQEKADRGHCA